MFHDRYQSFQLHTCVNQFYDPYYVCNKFNWMAVMHASQNVVDYRTSRVEGEPSVCEVSLFSLCKGLLY